MKKIATREIQRMRTRRDSWFRGFLRQMIRSLALHRRGKAEQSRANRAAVAAERRERIPQLTHFGHERIVVHENARRFPVFLRRVADFPERVGELGTL